MDRELEMIVSVFVILEYGYYELDFYTALFCCRAAKYNVRANIYIADVPNSDQQTAN